MENRQLVKKTAVLVLVLLFTSTPILANQKPQIRFYKANKQLQTSRIMFAGKRGRQSDCQNFLKKKRVYQVNQFGFAQCRLYSKKNCAADSAIQVTRSKDLTPAEQLTQGFSWFPISEHKRGVKLGSWQCDLADGA